MRDYAKISPQFWIGSTGRKLREAGPEATIVALYLLSNPHANMLGLYYMPKVFIGHETPLGPEGASKGLQRAIEVGFCGYDEASEVVFVFEMARYQIAEQLDRQDNRCKGIQREYDAVPDNAFLAMFYEKYRAAFHMESRRKIESPSVGASMPLRSQEQEQKQEQEQEKPSVAVAPVAEEPEPVDPRHAQIRQVIQYLHLQTFRVKCQWDGSEGKALDRLLSANPSWTDEELARMVRNRFASEAVTSERPRKWLSNIGSYAAGPHDRFNKLKGPHHNGNGNGNGNRAERRQSANLAAREAARASIMAD